jgi:hypothetical protein
MDAYSSTWGLAERFLVMDEIPMMAGSISTMYAPGRTLFDVPRGRWEISTIAAKERPAEAANASPYLMIEWNDCPKNELLENVGAGMGVRTFF